MDTKSNSKKHSEIDMEKLELLLSEYYEKCQEHAARIFQDYDPEEIKLWCKNKIREYAPKLREQEEKLNNKTAESNDTNGYSKETKANFNITQNDHNFTIN